MKTWRIAVLAGGLWACNYGATPEPTDTDNTQVTDSTPVSADTMASPDTGRPSSRTGVDSVQLDTLNKNDNRYD
jgi:hypothetical protein